MIHRRGPAGRDARGDARDPAVFLIGEDIGVPGGFGGAFTVTLGLSDEFGHERMLDTPISEMAIVGAAVGAALMGMRPIADMQYGDFLFCVHGPDGQSGRQDALTCAAGRSACRWFCARRWARPIAGRATRAEQGSMVHAHAGLKVVVPVHRLRRKGLARRAIRDDNPVLIFEHKLLYGGKGGRKEARRRWTGQRGPEEEYEVPLGQAVIRREGSDLTIVANMLMLHRALAAAEELAQEGINAEVIDVRTLVPLDMKTLTDFCRKDRALLIVEEDNLTGGWGAEVAARSPEAAFDLSRRADQPRGLLRRAAAVCARAGELRRPERRAHRRSRAGARSRPGVRWP